LAWPAVQPDPTPGVPLAPSSPHAPLSLSHFLFPCSNFPLPLFHLPCPRCDPVDGCRRSSSPEVSSASHLLSLLPLSPARGLPDRPPPGRPPCPAPGLRPPGAAIRPPACWFSPGAAVARPVAWLGASPCAQSRYHAQP
jgi:hypothetical protein